MRLKGTLVEWNDDRGFGFVQPAGGGDRAFCHISQFARRAKRPALGERFTYELSRDGRGRLRAAKILPIAASKTVRVEPGSSSRVTSWVAFVGALVFLAAVTGVAFMGKLPVIVPLIYLVLSLTTIAAYAFDKSAAMNRRWRTQEQTLQLLSLFGGWPGAWIAQLAFRHKTKKTSFVVTFLVCVILNLAALVWLVMNPEVLGQLG